MNETQFEAFIHCVLDKNFIDEMKQKWYLEALQGCILALVNLPCLTDEEAKRKTAIVITRAYVSELITAEESQSLMRFRRDVLKTYRKGVKF